MQPETCVESALFRRLKLNFEANCFQVLRFCEVRRYAKGDDAYRFAMDHFELLYEVAGQPPLPGDRTLIVDARMVAGPGGAFPAGA